MAWLTLNHVIIILPTQKPQAVNMDLGCYRYTITIYVYRGVLFEFFFLKNKNVGFLGCLELTIFILLLVSSQTQTHVHTYARTHTQNMDRVILYSGLSL